MGLLIPTVLVMVVTDQYSHVRRQVLLLLLHKNLKTSDLVQNNRFQYEHTSTQACTTLDLFMRNPASRRRATFFLTPLACCFECGVPCGPTPLLVLSGNDLQARAPTAAIRASKRSRRSREEGEETGSIFGDAREEVEETGGEGRGRLERLLLSLASAAGESRAISEKLRQGVACCNRLLHRESLHEPKFESPTATSLFCV